MQLTLSRRDIHHALYLQWGMTRMHPEWKHATYELRARLRDRHVKYVALVEKQIARRGEGTGVFELTADLVGFAKRRVIGQLIGSYIWGFLFLGWIFGLIGMAVVEMVAARYLDPSGSLMGAPLNPALVLAITTPIMSLLPTAFIAWARGTWRTLALVRHARRARRDPSYLLPTPHNF